MTEATMAKYSPLYKVVLFDFDGTLANTQRAITHCLQKTMLELTGQRVSQASIEATIGWQLRDVFLALRGHDNDIDHFITYYRRLYTSTALRYTTLYPGLQTLIIRCKTQGITPIITSNKGVNAIYQALDHFQLRKYVDHVIADGHDIPKKPDPAMVHQLVLPQYNIQRQECLVIGDTETDIQFAKNANVDCCWVTYGFGNREKCQQLQPEFIAKGAEQLSNIIFQ